MSSPSVILTLVHAFLRTCLTAGILLGASAGAWAQKAVCIGWQVGQGFQSPQAVVPDGNGNLYVADTGHHRIVKVSALGTITEIAGPTSPWEASPQSLDQPTGLALGPDGTLYISDWSRQRIGALRPEGGPLRTIADASTAAANGVPGLSRPGGLALGPDGNLYLADTGHDRILKIQPSTRRIESVMLDATPLAQPSAVAVDAEGTLYVADTGHRRILKLAVGASQAIEIVNSTSPIQGSTAHLGSPQGLALDASGQLLISDPIQHQILRWTGTALVQIQEQGLGSPMGIASGNQGEVLVADAGSDRILALGRPVFPRVPVGSSLVRQFVFTVTGETTLHGVRVSTQGASGLAFTHASTGTLPLGQASPAETTGTLAVRFAPAAPGASLGYVALQDPQGSVIATAYIQGVGEAPRMAFLPASQSVLKEQLGGSFRAVAVDASGRVFLLDTASGTLTQEGLPTPRIIAQGLREPQGLAVDGEGSLFVTCTGDSTLLKFTPMLDGSYQRSVIPFDLNWPSAVVADGAGQVFVADTGHRRVVRFSPTSAGTYNASVLTTPSLLWSSLTLDAAQNLYLGDGSGIFRLPLQPDTGGYRTIQELDIPLPGTLQALAADASGSLYLTLSNGLAIARPYPEGGWTATPLLSGADRFYGLALDARGKVYACSQSVDRTQLRMLDLATPPALSLQEAGSDAVGIPGPFSVWNNGNQDLQRLALPQVSSGFQLTSGDMTPLLAPASAARIEVAHASLPAGVHSGTLRLSSNHLNTSTLHTLLLATQPLGTDSVRASASVMQAPADMAVKTPAAITLGYLVQTYNGKPRPVKVTTSPQKLKVLVTYNGSTTVPQHAGTYAVVATIQDSTYEGTATATLTVLKAKAQVTLSKLTQTYSSYRIRLKVTTKPSRLPVQLTYNGLPDAPSAAGSYAVAATIVHPDYEGITNRTAVIKKATLKVKAAAKRKYYGDPVPPLTYAITGFKGSDTQATATTGAPTLITAGSQTSKPGHYHIHCTQGSLIAANYYLKFICNTLTIERGTPSITGFSASQTSITAGQSVTLTGTFSRGLGSIAPGVGSVTSGQVVTVTPSATTTYTLTVTSPGKRQAIARLTITVNPALGPTIQGNAGIAGVTLTYVDTTTKTVTSDGSGNYSLTVPSGWTGTVTPSLTGYTFSPTSRTYTNLTSNATGQDYTATPQSTYTSGGVLASGSLQTITVPAVDNSPIIGEPWPHVQATASGGYTVQHGFYLP